MVKHCKLCNREVDTIQRYSIGTLVLLIITFGFWSIIMLLYPERCPICNYKIRSAFEN